MIDAYTWSDQNRFSNFEFVPGLKLKILTRRALFTALACMAFSRALELEVVGFGSGSSLVEVGAGLWECWWGGWAWPWVCLSEGLGLGASGAWAWAGAGANVTCRGSSVRGSSHLLFGFSKSPLPCLVLCFSSFSSLSDSLLRRGRNILSSRRNIHLDGANNLWHTSNNIFDI